MLERGEAFGEPLAVVEPIHADDELAAQETGDHPLNRVLELRRHGFADHLIDLDADRIGAHPEVAARNGNSTVGRERRGLRLDARQKGAHVIVCLEP